MIQVLSFKLYNLHEFVARQKQRLPLQSRILSFERTRCSNRSRSRTRWLGRCRYRSRSWPRNTSWTAWWARAGFLCHGWNCQCLTKYFRHCYHWWEFHARILVTEWIAIQTNNWFFTFSLKKISVAHYIVLLLHYSWPISREKETIKWQTKNRDNPVYLCLQKLSIESYWNYKVY